EFRQLRRDRRTLAMMIVMPVVLLIVFGYAASFDVTTIPTVAAGPQAGQAAPLLRAPVQVGTTEPPHGTGWAGPRQGDGKPTAGAVVTGGGRPQVPIDGSQLCTAKAAIAALSGAAAKAAAKGAGAGGGQASTGQSSTGQSSTGQSSTGQASTGQSSTGQSSTG